MNSKMDPKAYLFKDLVFHINIMSEGMSMDENFKSVIQKAKGKVLTILTKNTTHLIWSGG